MSKSFKFPFCSGLYVWTCRISCFWKCSSRYVFPNSPFSMWPFLFYLNADSPLSFSCSCFFIHFLQVLTIATCFLCLFVGLWALLFVLSSEKDESESNLSECEFSLYESKPYSLLLCLSYYFLNNFNFLLFSLSSLLNFFSFSFLASSSSSSISLCRCIIVPCVNESHIFSAYFWHLMYICCWMKSSLKFLFRPMSLSLSDDKTVISLSSSSSCFSFFFNLSILLNRRSYTWFLNSFSSIYSAVGFFFSIFYPFFPCLT